MSEVYATDVEPSPKRYLVVEVQDHPTLRAGDVVVATCDKHQNNYLIRVEDMTLHEVGDDSCIHFVRLRYEEPISDEDKSLDVSCISVARELPSPPSGCGSIKALCDVLTEMVHQNEKWGEQNHDPFVYQNILMEEVGEMSQAALKTKFENGDKDKIREEAVQVAAVALAIVECLDRDQWKW